MFLYTSMFPRHNAPTIQIRLNLLFSTRDREIYMFRTSIPEMIMNAEREKREE